MTEEWQQRLQLHEISIAFKGSFQSVQLIHLLCKLLKAHYRGDKSATIVLDKTVDANICKQGYKKVSGPQLENSFK